MKLNEKIINAILDNVYLQDDFDDLEDEMYDEMAGQVEEAMSTIDSFENNWNYIYDYFHHDNLKSLGKKISKKVDEIRRQLNGMLQSFSKDTKIKLAENPFDKYYSEMKKVLTEDITRMPIIEDNFAEFYVQLEYNTQDMIAADIAVKMIEDFSEYDVIDGFADSLLDSVEVMKDIYLDID